MAEAESYLILLAIVSATGIVFRKSRVPFPFLLVIVGMCLSLLPMFPSISLKPEIILNIFLPMLVYRTSAVTSWKDVKFNFRPIILLSIGHVIFITFLVAFVVHTLIPELSWPLAFILGAVISPPDDVAIVAIAKNIRMPERIVTILKGEGMLNDAAALIIFRFSLLALITHQFSVMDAVSSFVLIIIGETAYGLLLGFLIGELRLKIKDIDLQMSISILTPFIAYFIPLKLGGSGILATVVTGLVISYKYLDRVEPEMRIVGQAFWSILEFFIQSILFLLVGLEFREILAGITIIPSKSLIFYALAVVATVIIGRFIWVYPATFIPRFLFPSIRKKDPYPPWQYPIVVSWAGMRGAISLAAAFVVPALPMVGGIDPRYLLLFLVFCTIMATLLLQGLSLPWLLKVLKVQSLSLREQYCEHLGELSAKLLIIKAVIRWLKEFKALMKDNPELLEEIKLSLQDYRMRKKRLQDRIAKHSEGFEHDEEGERRESVFLNNRILEVERNALDDLWHKDKINHVLRTKMQNELDRLETPD